MPATVTFEQLDAVYGEFAESGRNLLKPSLSFAARMGEPLDVMHIMLIVAQHPWPTTQLAQSPTIRRFLGDTKVVQAWVNALAANTVLLEPSPAVAPHTSPLALTEEGAGLVTAALDRCLDKARARWNNQPLTDAMLVWAILSDENAARAETAAIIRDTCPEVSLDAIVAELEQHADDSAPNKRITATDHLKWMPKLHAPHPTIQSHLKHLDVMLAIQSAIARVTEAPEQRRFVLPSGQNGSPLHELWRLLSDAVKADSEAYDGRTGVWVANISDYLRWADPPLFPGADKLLGEGIQYVQDQGGLLLLEHVEKLKQTTSGNWLPLHRELLGQLREVPGALIVALYETQPGDNPQHALREMGLDDQDAEPVAIPIYSAAHAVHSIKDHFAPEWEQQGFVFDGDVLDEARGPFCDILALADGARYREEPMAFPYLLVNITEYLMTRRSAPATISDWARTAKECVEALTPPVADQTGQQVKAYYDPLLTRALLQVGRLVDSPNFGKQGARLVITRAHLTATFLGSGLCEFVYPARLPTRRTPPPPPEPADGPDTTRPLMPATPATRASEDNRNRDRSDSQRHGKQI